jgi:signal transduction histidine kinase
VLDNLLANALDASPPGSRITVTVEPAGADRVRVRVADQGPGMTEAERRRAFDRFWRGATAGQGHSGLGLAIVKQLATRNDATVELVPAAPTGLDAVVTLRSRFVKNYPAANTSEG